MTKNEYERQAREAERVAQYFDCGLLPPADNVLYAELPGMMEARCMVNTGCGEVAALRTDGSVLVNCLDDETCPHYHHHHHNHMQTPPWVPLSHSSSNSTATSNNNTNNTITSTAESTVTPTTPAATSRIYRAPVRNVTCMTTVGDGVVVLGGDDGMVASLDVLTGTIYCAARVYQPHGHPRRRGRGGTWDPDRGWHGGHGGGYGGYSRGYEFGGGGGNSGSGRARHVRALSVDMSCIPGGLVYLAAGADVCALTHSGGRNIRCVKRVRLAHGGVVSVLDVVAGGGVVLTAGQDATVSVWDHTLRRRGRLQHPHNVECMAATKGAIVTACYGTVRIYDNNTATDSGNGDNKHRYQLRAELHGLSPRGGIAALMPSCGGRTVLVIPRRGHWAFVSDVDGDGDSSNSLNEMKVVRRVRSSPGFRCHAAVPGPRGQILVADSLGCYVANIERRNSQQPPYLSRILPKTSTLLDSLKPYRTHTTIALITASIALAAFAVQRNAWRTVP